jgi:hypothetical protein
MLPLDDLDAAFGGVPLVGFGVLSRTNSPAASTALLHTLVLIAPAVFLLGSPSAGMDGRRVGHALGEGIRIASELLLGEGIRIVSILLLRGFRACARKLLGN